MTLTDKIKTPLRTGYRPQQERMRDPKIHALNKPIVSFGAAKRKQNNSSLLAVIFIQKIKKDDTI